VVEKEFSSLTLLQATRLLSQKEGAATKIPGNAKHNKDMPTESSNEFRPVFQ
jgi:hypothetical protein